MSVLPVESPCIAIYRCAGWFCRTLSSEALFLGATAAPRQKMIETIQKEQIQAGGIARSGALVSFMALQSLGAKKVVALRQVYQTCHFCVFGGKPYLQPF